MAQMTLQAMEAFRSKYRAAISATYNGWIHMLSVAGIGLFVILYSLGQVNAASFGEWLVFPTHHAGGELCGVLRAPLVRAS